MEEPKRTEIDVDIEESIKEETQMEELSKAVSTQKLIDTLESCIIKLEKFKGLKLIKQLTRTVVLICKILAVELDKTLPENLQNHNNIYS